MTGPSSDPHLLGAAWANEERLAAQGDATAAKQHRAEDFEAAKARASSRSTRVGLGKRLARLFHHGR